MKTHRPMTDEEWERSEWLTATDEAIGLLLDIEELLADPPPGHAITVHRRRALGAVLRARNALIIANEAADDPAAWAWMEPDTTPGPDEQREGDSS